MEPNYVIKKITVSHFSNNYIKLSKKKDFEIIYS
jgi:hypothetical protein